MLDVMVGRLFLARAIVKSLEMAWHGTREHKYSTAYIRVSPLTIPAASAGISSVQQI